MTKQVEHSSVRKMSAIERSEAQMRTAMQSKEHMIRWMEGSGRLWMVFNGRHLVESWPDNPDDPLLWKKFCERWMAYVGGYRDHRSLIPTGDFETIKNPVTGDMDKVPIMTPETLTLVECDRAIRYLIGRASELDSAWRLENPAL